MTVRPDHPALTTPTFHYTTSRHTSTDKDA